MKKNGDDERFLPAEVLQAILDGMDAEIYVTDLQTNEILFINSKIKEHFHLGDEAISGVCWKVLQSGLDKQCEFCPVDRLLEDHDTPVVWERQDTRSGRHYRHTDHIIKWVDGRMAHLRHSTDITDSKLSEASLEKRLQQQELMSTISQNFTSNLETDKLIPQALEMAGAFMNVNQAFIAKYQKDGGVLECLFEWCDDQAKPYIGKEDKWPISPDMEIYQDLTSRGYAAVNDYKLLTHPNFETVKDYDLRAFLNIPIEVSGEFWGILGFIINKRTYNWSESDIHLGKLITSVFSGEITRNIAKENLMKAKAEAEAANTAKSEFLSRMSHEMRTPMNAILGMTKIAQTSDDPQKMMYCLERIDSSAKHLLGLINDVLDMSKIEAKSLLLSEAEFDFERMLMNITGVVNFQIDEKKQNLIINIDQNVPSVFFGDEMRLSQTIANLLSNSVKFTPENGTILLNVHAADASDTAATLLFEVIDNGIGISKKQQALLFTPFEQADGSIARKYGGTGLGLTICKNIVELMGGRIWIESELGHGSKFSFKIKMRPGKGIPRTALAPSIDKDGIHILVVEGSAEVRTYFSRVMSELGLSCDVAVSGLAALEKIKQRKHNPYNLFFVDAALPDSSGIALTKEIMRRDLDNIVIMIITEMEWGNTEKDAVEAGVNRFVFKPLFSSMLINAINESIGMAMESQISKSKNHTFDFSGHTLLVAEDIEINREIILAILENTQLTIEFAYNGVQALGAFEKNADRYSLILMDIQMPDMDGYEATRRIRALDSVKAKNVPIIAMTANVFQEDVERCLKAGMNDHIGKPVDSEELLMKLGKYLSASYQQRKGW